MAHSFISRFEVKPGKKEEFVRLCREMEVFVQEHEPQTLLYKFYKLDTPDGYAVLESFPDEAADQAHQQEPHAAGIIEEMIACMGDGGYTREYLRDLA